MKEITRNDFNHFQNEILGLMKQNETKIAEKITDIISNIEKTDLMSDQKFQNFKYDVELIVKNLGTNEIILNLNERLNDITKKFEELKTVNNTKISNFQRDLSDACFKYDRIFLNNISSPGLIGDGCPYPTMRAYLENVEKQIKDFNNSKDKFGIDFKKYHDWVQSSLDKFRTDFDNYKEDNEKFVKKELRQSEKKNFDKMNAVEDKLSFIKIENGRYNYKLNKRWEELEEKLQSFYFTNDNLIKIYNKAREEFIKSQKELNNVIQYLNSTQYISSNGKTTYDKFNKKIELVKPRQVNFDNILPTVNSLDDINKMAFNRNSTKSNNNEPKNYISQSHKKVLRLFTKKNTVNLGNMKFNKFNKNLNNNDIMDFGDDENENQQKNVYNHLSEDKIIKRKATFGRKNLVVEEKEQINLLNEPKSEKTKKELHGILEDEEEEHKENNDKQTSPVIIKEPKISKFNSNILFANKINSFTFERKEFRKSNEEIIKEQIKKNYDEEFNIIKFKFDDLYDRTNDKIGILTLHLNTLISRMNKIIFVKKSNLNSINESDFIPEKRKNKLFLDNSDNKIILPLNKSFDEKLAKVKKDRDNTKENIPSLKHELKINNHFNISDTYLIDKFKFKSIKTTDTSGNSNDLNKLLVGRNKNQKDYYNSKLSLQSINRIENFLIKKFKDQNWNEKKEPAIIN